MTPSAFLPNSPIAFFSFDSLERRDKMLLEMMRIDDVQKDPDGSIVRVSRIRPRYWECRAHLLMCHSPGIESPLAKRVFIPMIAVPNFIPAHNGDCYLAIPSEDHKKPDAYDNEWSAWHRATESLAAFCEAESNR